MASQPDTIGPSLFADSHYAPTDDARVVRRRQVFERARAGTTQGYKALAEYIVSTQDYGSLDSLLDILEARLLPPMPLDVSDPRVAVQLEVAMAALLDVSAVFRCFIAVPHHPQISACKTRCLEMLVERWSDVMKWLAYLLLNASSFANPPNILGTCIDTLLPIIVSAEKDILKEELLYLPYTIDYVYLLLCQVDKYTGKYYYLQLTKYGEMCAILNLFKSFIDSEIAFFNLLPRLKAVSPKTRKRIISALTVRAPQIAESAEATEAKSMMSAMYSLYTLIYCTSQLLCDPSLWTIFLEMGFLKEHGRALAIIAEKGHMSEVDPGDQFWKLLCATVILFVKTVVMKRTPNPTESFPSAMEGGILTSALRCLTHLDPTEKGTSGIIDDAITVILSYLPVEKVWKMAGSDDVYDALKDARRQSQGRQARVSRDPANYRVGK
ncbi:hypothetical protein DFP72DRAFT_34771 [Ephemerocybe angulata]|uniref:Uncharacterized protein n=1 Tax=Ephemerocybe angulata TaxID=980116 RepID=A0A8H6M9T8_9AGAR|nr:hypothetical protein DFP72DRAFT_34771 [Tulosesus angulatus]